GNSNKQRNIKRISSQISSGINLWIKMLTGELNSPPGNIKTAVNKLIITRSLSGEKKLVGYIDRDTLTLSRCNIFNKAGQKIFEMIISNYRSFPALKKSAGANKSNFV